jgi:hypothetical protein
MQGAKKSFYLVLTSGETENDRNLPIKIEGKRRGYFASFALVLSP